jgi:hypothetical protein
MYSEKLVKADTGHLEVYGPGFYIKNLEDEKVYVSTKSYLDKLFNEMGFKNLNVIRVLEEFAGKTVSEVGSLKDSCIYLCEDNGTFVVTSSNALSWVDTMFNNFSKNKFEIINLGDRCKYEDDCCSWDQYIIRTPGGSYFALYVDLLSEYVRLYRISYNPQTSVISGMIDEGKYKFNKETSQDKLMTMLLTDADISVEFNENMKLSLYELAQLFVLYGILEYKRDKYYCCEIDIELPSWINIESFCDDLNYSNWLKQRITPSVEFSKICDFISSHIDYIQLSSVYDIFNNNRLEKSDMSLIL